MYVTQQQLIDRFGETELIQLTDRAIPPASAIDDTVLNAAIDDAASFIDGYLETRFPLPLETVPQILQRIAGNVVRYYLYDDRATEQVTKLYEDAVKTLTAVRDGKMQLGLSALGEKPLTHDAAEMHSGGNVFDRESSKGFI